MSRLPVPGSDDAVWGDILNDYLSVGHNPDGTHKNSGGVTSLGATAPIISSGGATPVISITTATTGAAGSMSAADKTKLDGIESNATADMTGNEILTALGSVDGSGSGLDADRLDGLEGSAYLKSNVQNMTVSATAPGSPGVGDIWIDTSGS